MSKATTADEDEGDKILNLNVGGVLYTTSLSTLLKYSDSMLARMFSSKWISKVDEEGRYFIDADGDLFKYVLNFLRRSRLYLPRTFDEVQLDQLLGEAEYYQIRPLIDAVKNLQAPLSTDKTTMVIFMKKDYYGQHKHGVKILQCKCAHFYHSYKESAYTSYSACIGELEQQGYVSVTGLLEVKDVGVCLTSLVMEGFIKKENFQGVLEERGKFNLYEIWTKQ